MCVSNCSSMRVSARGWLVPWTMALRVGDSTKSQTTDEQPMVSPPDVDDLPQPQSNTNEKAALTPTPLNNGPQLILFMQNSSCLPVPPVDSPPHGSTQITQLDYCLLTWTTITQWRWMLMLYHTSCLFTITVPLNSFIYCFVFFMKGDVTRSYYVIDFNLLFWDLSWHCDQTCMHGLWSYHVIL